MKILIMLGVVFVWGVQPLYIIIRMVLVVLRYSLYIYYVIGRYWFRYIIILVILRGVMVLFSYIVSLSPNHRFEMGGLILVVIFIYLVYFYNDLFNMYEICELNCLDLWLGIRFFITYFVLFLLRIIVLVVWVRSYCLGRLRV